MNGNRCPKFIHSNINHEYHQNINLSCLKTINTLIPILAMSLYSSQCPLNARN